MLYVSGFSGGTSGARDVFTARCTLDDKKVWVKTWAGASKADDGL